MKEIVVEIRNLVDSLSWLITVVSEHPIATIVVIVGLYALWMAKSKVFKK